MSTYAEYVSLFSQTWSKQSYGLLDYEAKDLNSQKLKIRASVNLQRKCNKLMIREEQGRREEKFERREKERREEGKRKRMEEVCKEEEKEDQRSSEEDEKEEGGPVEEGVMEDEIDKREEEEESRRKEGEVNEKEKEGRRKEKEKGERIVKKITGEKEKLCKIVKVEENFFLGPWREGLKVGFDALWMVLGHKNYKREENYALNERDVFKIGRMTFKVMNVIKYLN